MVATEEGIVVERMVGSAKGIYYSLGAATVPMVNTQNLWRSKVFLLPVGMTALKVVFTTVLAGEVVRRRGKR